jgi:hypothetical protein
VKTLWTCSASDELMATNLLQWPAISSGGCYYFETVAGKEMK